MSNKTSKQLERHLKGISNHWRIEILLFIDKNKGVSLEEIVDGLKVNIKTASGHTRGLFQAGLINKKYYGRKVEHSLSPYGRYFAKCIKQFKTTF